jgi:hypothetical protein
MMQQCQDEIMATVFRERDELEHTIGKPRDGWDPLPFEKFMATERILQKLPEPIPIEKIKEIRLEEIFDRAAEAQILAVQQRLSEALESVKKAAQEQQEEMRLPALPTFTKRESSIEVAPLAQLPDRDEKRSINVDLEQHYAKQLKIVVPEEDTLQRAIKENGFSTKSETAITNDNHQSETGLSVANGGVIGNITSPEQSPLRSVEAIAEDIEKMVSRGEDRPPTPNVLPQKEISPPPVPNPELQKIRKKTSSIRPSRGIVISALKSKIQQGSPGDGPNQSATIRENVDPNGDQRSEDLVRNLFAGMAQPQLPLSENLSPEEENEKSNGNNERFMATHRQQSKTRRFYL